MHFTHTISPLIAQLFARICAVIILTLMLYTTAAMASGAVNGRSQASIQVQARVISLSGGAELRQASAELIGSQAQRQAIAGAAAPADGAVAPPTERYVHDGLIRLSLMNGDEAWRDDAGVGGRPAAAWVAPELLIEYVGN